MNPNQMQPQQPMQPAPPVQGYAAEDPGKTMGIISLVLGLLNIGLVGLILGIMARSKSKAAGYNNGVALAGIIVSVITMIGTIIAVISIVALGAFGFAALDAKCKELGPGTHYEGSTRITCGANGYESSN
ncbi:DUF4190 domain-containing protein [Patescibacteria group bacterium]|nr:DUF4190 domain-containing protein [Patescibacteria group bacterium]